jgi:hypothetical protein
MSPKYKPPNIKTSSQCSPPNINTVTDMTQLQRHNSQITTAPAKPFPFYDFTSRSLARASNSGNSSASRESVPIYTGFSEELKFQLKVKATLQLAVYRQ